MRKDKPWSVQVEFTYGCNRKCDFCYKQVINKPNYDYMSLETAKITAQELSIFDPVRFKFAMRGEPLLNPEWLNIVSIFREYLPKSKLLLTTNGELLTNKNVQQFFDNGGNTLIVDCYGNSVNDRLEQFKEFNPTVNNSGSPWEIIESDIREMFLIPDLINNSTDTRKLNNLAGNITDEAAAKYHIYHNRPLSRICTRPFGEMYIQYDGSIVLCCHDGEPIYKLWDVRYGQLSDYWNYNIRLNDIRNKLINGNRCLPLCKDCNYFGGDPKRLNGYKIRRWGVDYG